jgi:hypothetical protein
MRVRVWGLGIRVPGCGLVAETGRGCGVVRLGGGQAEVTDARGPLAGRVGCGSGGVRQREVATRPPAWPAPAEPKGGARLAFCWRLPRFASLLVLFACPLPARRQGCGLPLAPHQRRGAATASRSLQPVSFPYLFGSARCGPHAGRKRRSLRLALEIVVVGDDAQTFQSFHRWRLLVGGKPGYGWGRKLLYTTISTSQSHQAFWMDIHQLQEH